MTAPRANARIPATTDDLRALARGRLTLAAARAAYDNAVDRLWRKAEAERGGHNPLGGESDDTDVAAVLPDGTTELPRSRTRRVFVLPTGATLVVGRVNSHPWAYRVLDA